VNRINEQLENFAKAFSTETNGCRHQCHCGKEFFDNFNSWDWNEGEYEALVDDPEAVGLGYAIERFELEGSYYVIGCDCWFKVAERYINFLDRNKREIGKYFSLEKESLLHEISITPDIEGEL
jgi:hypothetical protein